LARSDPGFLEFLKGEKSDLLAFDDGELSAESDEENQKNTNDVKKKKKFKVIMLYLLYYFLFSLLIILGDTHWVLYDNYYIWEALTDIKLFADDTKIYVDIFYIRDFDKLQHALDLLVKWAELWQLKIAMNKCFTLNIGKIPSRSAVATNACSVTRSLKLSNVEPG